MRSTADRIRHAIGFELFGLLGAMPLLRILFGIEPMHSGLMALFLSLLATGWNFLYNQWFDRYLQARQGHSDKTRRQRIAHAVGFEFGLLVISLPIIAWWLGVSLLSALLMDAAMVVYYLFFAYFYNLAYDKLFPLVSQHKLNKKAALP